MLCFHPTYAHRLCICGCFQILFSQPPNFRSYGLVYSFHSFIQFLWWFVSFGIYVTYKMYICIVAVWAKRDVFYSFLIEKSTEWLVFKAGARLICPFSDFPLWGSFFISHSPFHCRNKLVNSIYYFIYNLDLSTAQQHTHTHTVPLIHH